MPTHVVDRQSTVHVGFLVGARSGSFFEQQAQRKLEQRLGRGRALAFNSP